jgi:hypothetical protein
MKNTLHNKLSNWEFYLLHGLPLYHTPNGEYYALVLDNTNNKSMVIISKFPMDMDESKLTIKVNEKL